MNHDEAKRMMASERYLLDELASAEREQFEEHIFSCRECALDLRAGAAFIDQSRMILGEREASPATAKVVAEAGPSWWAAWLRPAIAFPVMAILLAAVVYQAGYELPGLRREAAARKTPALLASASLMNANTRGGEVPEVKVPQGKPFLLFVDVPEEKHQYASFVAEFYGPSQNLLWSLPISSDSAKNTLSLRVPPVHGSGPYMLEIRGVNANGQKGPEIARYPFELETQSR